MKPFKLDRWVQQISQTQVEELSCSDCLDLVDQYVEAELVGAPLSAQMEQVKHHLYQCQVCREEYQILSDLVREETAGRAPSVDDLKRSL